MRRIASLSLAALALVLAVTGCAKPKVTVRTGERVYCVYGEMLEDDVRTIQVDSKDVADYSVEERTELCDRHRRLAALYDVAQGALERRDGETAEKTLTALVAQDSGFRRASEQLAQLRRGTTPAPDREAAPTPDETRDEQSTPNTSTTKPSGPAASMARFAPDALEGFKAGKVVVEDFTLTRPYVPQDTGRMLALVIVAEQYVDKRAAEGALDRFRRNYATDAETLGNGAHLGTDGNAVAGAVWRTGSIVVVAELAPAQGDPKAVKRDLAKIAETLFK